MAGTAPNLAAKIAAAPPGAALAVAREHDFDYASDAYRDLFEASGATAFQHPLWLNALMRHVAPARGARSVPVVGRDGDGELVFVLPMIARVMNGVTLLESADLGVSDYSAPVIRAGSSLPADIGNRVAAALPRHDILRLRPVPADNAGWSTLLCETLLPLGFSAHAARPTLPWDEWRAAAYDASFAKRLARKMKSLDKAGDNGLVVLDDPDEIRASVRAIRALRAGRFEGDPIQTDAVAAFYEEVAISGAGAGFARTWRLDLDGEPVGHVFGLTWRGRFHYLLIGCDYERFGRFSPGLVMYDRMMRDWAEAGGDTFDFTIGDEPFKADFGTVPTAMLGLEKPATTRGRLALLARDARDRLRRLSPGG
ncbi:MAG: GNAT family N-acetyltransferase [Rhizobiaceae bacterium]|nr:GNAT family N-acetyltransferase [Rhizobiaceae bacterium]MCV0408431.1 GNAT family N-acetyltransferase [Rhizobiaceae bacterium]